MQANNTIGQPAPNNAALTVSYSTATLSSALPTNCNVVRLTSTTDCYVEFASTTNASPTATSSSAYLPAFAPEYFVVLPGSKISALQVSAAGTLNIVPFV